MLLLVSLFHNNVLNDKFRRNFSSWSFYTRNNKCTYKGKFYQLLPRKIWKYFLNYRFHIRFGDLAYIKSLKYSSIYIFRTIVDDGIYQNLVLINAMSDNPMAAASFFTLKKVP